jgi:hypothetical protein
MRCGDVAATRSNGIKRFVSERRPARTGLVTGEPAGAELRSKERAEFIVF